MSVQEVPSKPSAQSLARRLPIGAELLPQGGAHFRVWAPKLKELTAVLDTGESVSLQHESNGYFWAHAPTARAGTRYRFRADQSENLYPDPASRFQPEGVHGPSEIIDHTTFKWTDSGWKGRGAEGQIIYEMHIGTFTRQGTWAAATERLKDLAEVGINCLEVMPVADFAGTFGWGYDGVDLFAPTRLYGRPDDFRRFIDTAHRLNLSVILDVVYNHFGPDGNYVNVYSDDYFNSKHMTDWGQGINYDGPNNASVREFFLSNIRYWLEEFHLDGFRFDATQAILDDSKEHILAQISCLARDVAAKQGKKIFLVNENEPQLTRLVRATEKGGYGMDALWNDDFHHTAWVSLSAHNEAYYSDHLGEPQEFISAAKWGYLFQGQRYDWQKKRRGSPALDLPPTAFVNFIQNHDQVANSASGHRVHQVASPALNRAITALFLLMPQTPMLFQGQEWAASSTFHYFADHHPELAKLVASGRANELSQFPSVCVPAMKERLLDPADRGVFERCKLNWDERSQPMHAAMLQFHKDILKLRFDEPVFRRLQKRGEMDGAVLGAQAFMFRYFGDNGDDRLLLVNLGRDLHLCPCPEPLLAPPSDMRWQAIWSSEDPCYGGSGSPPPDTEREGWFLTGRCTMILRPVSLQEGTVLSRISTGGSPRSHEGTKEHEE